MYNDRSSPRLTNVIFSENSSVNGGGMSNYYSSSPQLTNVIFLRNSAPTAGGGMYNQNSSPQLTNVTFSENTSDYGYGGGMSNYYSSSLQLTNVTFLRNSAFTGGGMSNSHHSSPRLTNVTFSENHAVGNQNGAASAGGGMANFVSSSPLLINVTFSENTANFAGGMFNHTSSPLLINVTFSRNSAARRAGSVFNRRSSLIFINTLVLDGKISNTDGYFIYDGSRTAYFSLIQDMAADTSKGNLNGVGLTASDIFAGTAALADNGNPLAQTVALTSNSPAIGAGALIWQSGNDYYASKGTTVYKLESTGVTAAALPADAKLISSGANKNSTVTPSNAPIIYPDIGSYQH